MHWAFRVLEECQKHLNFLLLAVFLSKLFVLVCLASLELYLGNGTEERGAVPPVLLMCRKESV